MVLSSTGMVTVRWYGNDIGIEKVWMYRDGIGCMNWYCGVGMELR